MSFQQRGPGRCKWVDESGRNTCRHNDCRYVHPGQPGWENARPWESRPRRDFDESGPGHGRGNWRGNGAPRGDGGRGRGRGGPWQESRNDNGGGGGGYGARHNSNDWNANQASFAPGPAHHAQPTQQTDSWGSATFTESTPTFTGPSNTTSSWGNAPQTNTCEAKTKHDASSWDDWGNSTEEAGWGSSANDNTWGSNDDGGGWGTGDNNGGGAGGWGDTADNAAKSGEGGQSQVASWPSTNNPKSDGGWGATQGVPEANLKGKGRVSFDAGGGGGRPAAHNDHNRNRRASNDNYNPTPDSGWSQRSRLSHRNDSAGMHSPPTSRRPSGAHVSFASPNGDSKNGDGWGAVPQQPNSWPDAGGTGTTQTDADPSNLTDPVKPEAPPEPPKQGSFASQLIDALFRSDNLRQAEARLERTQRMAKSERYKHPSRALADKLKTDLANASDDAIKKSDELASRLRRIAMLPGGEKVFEHMNPAIELAWLREGDLQKWRYIIEPAARVYFDQADSETMQKAKMDGMDPRPNWVRELPTYKNVKPMTSEQAKAVADNDWMLRGMIHTFGTADPSIRNAVALANAEGSQGIYGPQIAAIEQQGSQIRTQVTDLFASLQEQHEKEGHRREEEALISSEKSVSEWRRMFAASRVVYDMQKKDFQARHTEYAGTLQKLETLPPVDDVRAIATSLRPAMLESIQRLAGPRVDAIVTDARCKVEKQQLEQAHILQEGLRPVLVLMEYRRMQERLKAEAEKQQRLIHEQSGQAGRPEGRQDQEPREPVVSATVRREAESPSTTLEEEEVDELIESPRLSRSTSASAESASDIRL